MTRHPLVTLVIALLLVAASALAVARLRIDTSLGALFNDNDPSARALTRVLEDFRSVEELLILAETPDNEPPHPQSLLDFAQRLTTAIDRDPVASKLADGVIYRVDPQTRRYFERVVAPRGLFYLDDTTYAEAKQRLTPDGMAAQIRRDEELIATPGPAAGAMSKVLLKDPLRLHEFLLDRLSAGREFHTWQNSDAFLSPDGRALLIRVRGNRPISDLDFCKRFTTSIESRAAGANAGRLRLSFSGAYPIAATSAKAIRFDMIAGVIGSVLALQALFLLAYRRGVRSFLLAFVPVAIGTLYGFGVYALLSRQLTPMTAGIGGILAGMAIDYAIAYLSFYHARRAGGMNATDAAESTRRGVGTAILAAWATSVIGFIAIAFSSTRALRDFALLGGLGLTGAFLAAVLVLPAVLVLIDRRASAAPASHLPTSLMLRWIGRRPGVVLIGATTVFAVACVILLMPGPLLPLESDLSVMHPRPNAPLEAQARIAQRMGGSPGTFVVYLHARDSAALQSLAHEVEHRLARPPVRAAGVVGTLGLASLLPDPSLAPARIADTGPKYADRVVADFHVAVTNSIFDPAAYKPYEDFLRTLLTATDPPTIADLVKYPALADNLLPASAFTSSDPPHEAITLIFLRDDGESRQSRDAAVGAIRSALNGLDGATLTGLSVLGHDVELSIRRQLPRLILAAVILAAVYLAIHFRNLTDCLLAMLPSIFSLVCLLAWMRVTGEKLNMVNLVAFPLLVGIDVDYGIFLVSAARSKRLGGLTPAQLIDQLDPAAGAVLLCAASTLLGFGSLMMTSIPAVRSLGQAVAVGVIGCVAGTFCLALPAIFILRARREAAAE